MAVKGEALAFFTITTLLVWAASSAVAAKSNDSEAAAPVAPVEGLVRSTFPKGFIFGAATSAYQVEGAVSEDGRLPSTWDIFSNTPGKILDGSNGDEAVDQYHRYKEDIDRLKEMGMDMYRFSIAWPRIYPKGSPRNGDVNELGINHYNKVIDYIISKGLTPFVTLFHWDLPQALEDEYLGWLNKKIVEDLVAFAEVCFEKFGDRVKHWGSINEPYIFSTMAYDSGMHAPGRCSDPFGNCTAGNSTTEPYIVAHNILLAHAAVVDVYKRKYSAIQKGEIGIVQVANWAVPYSPTRNNDEATKRAREFSIGWFMHPLVFGSYPSVMREIVKDRLPEFTDEEAKLVKGSFDWIGINYYSTNLVVDNPNPGYPRDHTRDMHANLSYSYNGTTIGEAEGSFIFRSYPKGLREVLHYFKSEYGNPKMYILETGYIDENNGSVPLRAALNDTGRVKYHQEHLQAVLSAIDEDKCNVHAYTVWSLLDNFEWSNGYIMRFGLYYVDYKNNLRRVARASADWFRYFLSH